MLGKLFLHGGEDKPESRQATFGRFAAEALPSRSGKLALIPVEETAVTTYGAAVMP